MVAGKTPLGTYPETPLSVLAQSLDLPEGKTFGILIDPPASTVVAEKTTCGTYPQPTLPVLAEGPDIIVGQAVCRTNPYPFFDTRFPIIP
jgi:hypothetical protein